jgi:hypothetical protein
MISEPKRHQLYSIFYALSDGAIFKIQKSGMIKEIESVTELFAAGHFLLTVVRALEVVVFV